jgi:ABC-2 type transport system permease protein
MAFLTDTQTAAIVWVQWRALVNQYLHSSRGAWIWITLLLLLAWYGLWVFGALAVYALASDPEKLPMLERALPGGLFLMFGYWQIVPVMLVSSGLSLDLNRLLIYPMPTGRLFGIEVLLRLTTAPEMVIITSGLAVGLAQNPALPWRAPLPLLLFTAFNLLLSAGLRDLLTRLMARRYLREAVVIVLVLLAAAPQLLLRSGVGEGPRELAGSGFGWFWPWTLTASPSVGHATFGAAGLLLAWTAAAWLFGRWQFERTLRFDSVSAHSRTGKTGARSALLERLIRLPSVLFKDPLAVLIEKELRILTRAPRFRLLFIMGFSFGLMIWLPMAMGQDPDSPVRGNYLTLVSAYALLLLGEVCFWNTFGMDRTAVANYFVAPVPLATVILARNLASAVFVALEVALVCFVCFLLRLPVSPAAIFETCAVIAVLSVFLFAMGNIISTRHPRPVNPAQSWRNSSGGRIQILLLLAYPLIGSPILLAYGARYAFEEELAFYGVLLIDLIAGLVTYVVSLESAASYAQLHSEEITHALSQSQGPVGV